MTPGDAHRIATPAVGNLREIGGRATADGGTVARGVAYRSAELASDAITDDEVVAALRVRTVVDLRTAAERLARPDVLPAGAHGVTLDVLAGLPTPTGPLAELAGDPAALEGRLDGLDVVQAMTGTYQSLVVDRTACTAYAAFVRLVADPTSGPVLFHCTAGKDRTGWGTTILLLAAGVDEDGAMEEFLAVNPAVRELFAPAVAGLGPLAEVLLPAFEVRPEYLEAALATVRARFGSFDGYLRGGLGLADDEVARLRRRLRPDA